MCSVKDQTEEGGRGSEGWSWGQEQWKREVCECVCVWFSFSLFLSFFLSFRSAERRGVEVCSSDVRRVVGAQKVVVGGRSSGRGRCVSVCVCGFLFLCFFLSFFLSDRQSVVVWKCALPM